jgi:hypothetical protein
MRGIYGIPGWGLVLLACWGSGARARSPASPNEAASLPMIRYVWFGLDSDRRETPEKIKSYLFSPEKWQALREGGRYDMLTRARAANANAGVTRNGNRHVACFEGTAAQVAQAYFSDDSVARMPIKQTEGSFAVRPSADGFLLGISYVDVSNPNDPRRYHFRLPSCHMPGKNSLVPALLRRAPQSGAQGNPSLAKLPPLEEHERRDGGVSLKAPNERAPQSVAAENGFQILDSVAAGGEGLPRFALRADFDRATFDPTKDRPWKGMDIRTPAGAEKFALLLLEHFYQGMADQSTDPNANFIAANNSQRYWCHMPWLNVGPSGREAVHGLTKERDLVPSAIFPGSTPGSDWGVAYFNGKACQALGTVFGSARQPNAQANFSKPPGGFFSDGSMVVKTLFTTADFPALKGAFLWKANVSALSGQNQRSVQPVRMLQIDIAVRDSSLIGAKPELDHWVMATYYFDASYHAPWQAKFTGALSALAQMRPQGVQLGLDIPGKGDTVLIAGAVTNGAEGRLNGPADNPASSCLSCHATAGTSSPMVPGAMTNESYSALRPNALDFSQQLSFAKRNVETAAP